MALFSRSGFLYLWNTYHLLDWIVLTVMVITATIVQVSVKPYCRTFSWSDATIGYPQHADTFPNYSLVIMVFGAMLFYVFFVLYLVKPLQRLFGEPMEWYSLGSSAANTSPSGAGAYADVDAAAANAKRVRIRDMQTGRGPLYPWLRAHLWAVGMTFCIQAVLKVYAGRLRPDYLARLKKLGYTSDIESLPSPQTNPEFYCALMDTQPLLREGRLSFPSGHSSTSFAVFTVLFFFFVAYLRPFARQASFTRLVICLLPLIVPAMCAVSRTRDNKHHFADILAGSLLGIACAFAGFCGSFRHVGGAAGIYCSRTAADVDYNQLRLPHTHDAPVPSANAGGAADGSSNVDFGATQQREDSEFRKKSSPTARTKDADGDIVVADNVQAASHVVMERKLNEDPAAVPWI